MSCILLGMVGFGLLMIALRPLGPIASRVTGLIASRFDATPERELVPIRVDRRAHR
jgi:hypothetical protein